MFETENSSTITEYYKKHERKTDECSEKTIMVDLTVVEKTIVKTVTNKVEGKAWCK